MFHFDKNSPASSFPTWGGEMNDFAKYFLTPQTDCGETGTRQLLQRIYEHIPLLIHEVPSGTQIFDWVVPLEWKVEKAYLTDSHGNTWVDVADDPNFVMGYSKPVHEFLSWEELSPHLFSNPKQPNDIPSLTSYYNNQWGFCIPHTLREQMGEDIYEVCIEASFTPGYLSYGEFYIPGESHEEILIHVPLSYPFTDNSNCYAITLATFLAKSLDRGSLRKYSYRFLFAPSTIGTIAWLALNQEQVDRIRNGIVLSDMGPTGEFSYQQSRQGNAGIDQVFQYIGDLGNKVEKVSGFSPSSTEARQFNSPGFNMPVGCLSRPPLGGRPTLLTHTTQTQSSRPQDFEDSLHFLLEALDLLETNEIYQNLNPFCEPQWEKRRLHDATHGGATHGEAYHLSLLWTWSESDGKTSLIDIARKSQLPYWSIQKAAKELETQELLRPMKFTPRSEVLLNTYF